MKITIYISFFLCSLVVFPQAIRQKKTKQASAIYGYFSGVETALETISSIHPEMQNQIKSINLLKSINFGQSKKNAMAYLSSQGDWQKEINKTVDSIKTIITSNVLISSKEQIIQYLKDTEHNFKGNIPPPLLEYALTFQYEKNPSEEFSNGYTYTYSTKGHTKSKNTEVILTIPKSWTSQEGKNPNVIQLFNSDCGTGLNTINILTQELQLSKDEMKLSFDGIDKVFERDMFTNEFAKTIVDGGKIISFKPMRIANRSGCLITHEKIFERLGITLKMKMYTFAFHDVSYLHVISCGTSASGTVENLDEKADKVFPLFQMVINSIIISTKNKELILLNGDASTKKINIDIGSNTLEFILDTGATISSLNQEIFNKLYETKIIKNSDFLKKGIVELADGQKIKVEYWKIPKIKIGNKILNNIVFVIQKNNNATPLLGMNILNALGIWKIDLDNNKIYLKN